MGMRLLPQFEFDELDIGFAVNLHTLRHILQDLSVGGKRWWIACNPVDVLETHVLTIGHGDRDCIDRLNTLYFDVPVFNALKPTTGIDRQILLLDSSVISAVDAGLYMENGRVVEDPFADLECFYQPIRKALIDRLRRE